MGLGTLSGLSRSEHQGSHKVWGTQSMTMGTTNPSIYSKEAITERPLRSYVDTAFVNHAPDYSNRSVK
jgi:hypothetical protein